MAGQRLELLLQRSCSRQHLGSTQSLHKKVTFSEATCPAHGTISLSGGKLMIWNQMHLGSSAFSSITGGLDPMEVKIPISKIMARIAWKSQDG